MGRLRGSLRHLLERGHGGRHQLTHALTGVKPGKARDLVKVLPVALGAVGRIDRAVKRLDQTIGLGLRIGGGAGALALAFLMGFCVDVLSGSPLGLYALLRGTACVATRLVDRALYLRASLPWAIYVMAYAFVDAVLMSLTLRVLVPEGVIPWGTVLLHVPLAGFITAILAVPVLSVTLRLEAELQGEGAWTSLTPRARV